MPRHAHHHHHKHRKKYEKNMAKDWEKVKKVCPLFFQYTVFCFIFILFTIIVTGVIISTTVRNESIKTIKINLESAAPKNHTRNHRYTDMNTTQPVVQNTLNVVSGQQGPSTPAININIVNNGNGNDPDNPNNNDNTNNNNNHNHDHNHDNDKDDVYDDNDDQPLKRDTVVNIYNNIARTIEEGIFISVAIVGKGFYFPLEIDYGNSKRTVFHKLGQFYVDTDGFVKDMMGFKLKPYMYVSLDSAKKYVMSVQRDGNVYVEDEFTNKNFVSRIKLAYIQNPEGLDFLDTYPFYIDCVSVKCTRKILDEMPIWYYVTTQESGDADFKYPWNNRSGYMRSSLAFGNVNLYIGGTTPYD